MNVLVRHAPLAVRRQTATDTSARARPARPRSRPATRQSRAASGLPAEAATPLATARFHPPAPEIPSRWLSADAAPRSASLPRARAVPLAPPVGRQWRALPGGATDAAAGTADGGAQTSLATGSPMHSPPHG